MGPLLLLRPLTGWWYLRAYVLFCSLILWSLAGSVFASLLYNAFTADLNRIILEIMVISQQYANDTQAYVHGPPAAAATLVDQIVYQSETLAA